MCSLSIYINSKTKSAMRSSPPSHWKLTASAPSCHRNFSVSLVLRIFNLRQGLHVHARRYRLLALELENADSRGNSYANATCKLSLD